MVPTAKSHPQVNTSIKSQLWVEDIFSFLGAGYEMVLDVEKQYNGNEVITHLSRMENYV